MFSQLVRLKSGLEASLRSTEHNLRCSGLFHLMGDWRWLCDAARPRLWTRRLRSVTRRGSVSMRVGKDWICVVAVTDVPKLDGGVRVKVLVMSCSSLWVE